MGSFFSHPLSPCINAYHNYKEERCYSNNLYSKDKTNYYYRGDNTYRYESFINDNSFLENQKWIGERNKRGLLFSPEKLITAYQDYKFDQVKIMQK